MSEIKALDMMRQAAKGGFPGSTGYVNKNARVLFGLADDESLFDGIANRIEMEIAMRYMLKPIDADGMPIDVGDSLRHEEMGYFVCNGITYYHNTWRVIDEMDFHGEHRMRPAKECKHVKPRTLEDVLGELEGLRGYGNSTYEDVVTRAAELADEIRELLGKDKANG